MKNLKLFLESEEDEDLTLGLVRLAKEIPDYELFYQINQINGSQFKRTGDLRKSGTFYDYFHPKFEAYHTETKTCFTFIANKSVESHKKQEINELFAEGSINYLLEGHKDVDYIMKTNDAFGDFSLILWPENLVFHIQNYPLSSNEELYQLIQYYE